MSLTTTSASPPARAAWQMWVPCIGMALCSWLAFVDRQAIAVLSPTIMAETGMNAQEFGRLVTFFFVAYTLGNPLWGSLLDYVGLRLGMLVAVAIWTAASASHAFMGTFLGFAMARAVLGFGEGATFPGGLRTAVESLPANMRARGIAASFSGGTIGAVVTPLIVLPVAAAYGWQAAFLLTGLFGIVWLLIWATIARPPFLPARTQKPARMAWPNPAERRFWMLVFSYALPAIAPGPIITLFQIYLNRELGVAQADLRGILWMPPLAWGAGYFFWGWIADRFASNNPASGRLVSPADRMLARPGRRAAVRLGARRDRADVVGVLHRRRIPDDGAQGGALQLPARAGGDDVRHRVRRMGARQCGTGGTDRAAVRSAAVVGGVLARGALSGRRHRGVAVPQPRATRSGRRRTRSIRLKRSYRSPARIIPANIIGGGVWKSTEGISSRALAGPPPSP